MKKIILTIAALSIIYSSKAQKAFEKGNVTVSLGAGLDLYGTKIHQVSSGFTKDTTDGAGGSHFPLMLEYGVANWLGIGARFNFSNFLEETDSISHIKPIHRGIDAGIVLNIHLVKSKRFDMPINLSFGYSYLSIQSKDALETIAKSNGLGYGIALMPRIYFGDHIGMFFNLGYMGYNYPKITYSNMNDSNLNKTWDTEVSLKANGVNLGIGLIGKF